MPVLQAARETRCEVLFTGPRMAAVLGAIATGVIAAGCGGGSPKATTTSSSFAAQQLAFSKCVREHGIPSFPDPGGAPPDSGESSIGGIAIPASINPQSPAFRTAWSACQGLMSGHLGPQGRPGISAAMKTSLIAHAQCMRTHGVPGYQDPQFPASGGIMITDAGTDPLSPAYKRAAAICGSR